MRPLWKSLKTGWAAPTIVIEDPDTSVTPSLYLRIITQCYSFVSRVWMRDQRIFQGCMRHESYRARAKLYWHQAQCERSTLRGDKLNFFEITWSITKTILTFLRALQFQLQHLGTHKSTRITANKTGDNETFLKSKKRSHIEFSLHKGRGHVRGSAAENWV